MGGKQAGGGGAWGHGVRAYRVPVGRTGKGVPRASRPQCVADPHRSQPRSGNTTMATRCRTLRAQTATPPVHPRMHAHSRDHVCTARGVCMEQGSVGRAPRCACRRGRCPERPRPCVCVPGRPRDAGLGRVPRCDRHRDLCHSACEPCAHSNHACRARSVPSVTSAPCRPPRSQVSDAWRKRSEVDSGSEYAPGHEANLRRGHRVSLLCGRGAAVRLTGRVLNCTQSGSRASPNGDAVCCGYAAQALERARLPPSALLSPYVMNELNGDDRVSRLRAA